MISDTELFAMRDLASTMAYSADPFDRVAAGESLIKLIDEYRALLNPGPVSHLTRRDSWNEYHIRAMEGGVMGMSLEELLALPDEEMTKVNSMNGRGQLRELIAYGRAYRLAHPLPADELPPKTLDGEV